MADALAKQKTLETEKTQKIPASNHPKHHSILH